MEIKLSDHFSFKRLLRFTFPSIVMMVFTSIYGVVDGFFVSNFAGKTSFAAVNFTFPLLMMLACTGFMFGTGGSALVAKLLGEGKEKRASRTFSMIVLVSFILAVIISAVGFIFMEEIISLMGAEGELHKDSVLYGRIELLALPFFALQIEFQSFFITAEKPKIALLTTIIAGVSNMILDALLVWVFPLGLVGAAVATAASQVIGGAIPIVYFFLSKDSLIRFTKPAADIKAIIKTMTNGSSELLNNISMSLVSMLYNIQLLKLVGEDGVSAYGIMTYINMIFIAVFIGFSIGTAPIISFHFGAQNSAELKSLLKKSLMILTLFSVSMLILGLILNYPLAYLFVGYDKELLSMTVKGFFIYAFSFLFSGMAIFFSSFFTALNDGATSAFLAFMRTLVFQVLAVMLLPVIFGLDGIWVSVVVAELLAVIVGSLCLIAKRKKYNY